MASNLTSIIQYYGANGANIVALLHQKLSLYLTPIDYLSAQEILRSIRSCGYFMIYSEDIIYNYMSRNIPYQENNLYETYSESLDTGRGVVFKFPSPLGTLVYLLRSPHSKIGFGVYAVSRIERGTTCFVYTGCLIKSDVIRKRQTDIYDPKVC